MPAPASAPLQQCTLYLFASDAEFLRRRYGRQWQEHVRNLVHTDVARTQNNQRAIASAAFHEGDLDA